MIIETQISLLENIAKEILTQKPGTWSLFCSYRPHNGVDDVLTKEAEALMLFDIDAVKAHLKLRMEHYKPELGLFIDIACDRVDENGERACDIDWVHVGFDHECMDLVIDNGVKQIKVVDYNDTKLSQLTNELTTNVFSVAGGYVPFNFDAPYIKLEILDPTTGGFAAMASRDGHTSIGTLGLTSQEINKKSYGHVIFHYDSSAMEKDEPRYVIRQLKKQLKAIGVKLSQDLIDHAKLISGQGEFISLRLVG